MLDDLKNLFKGNHFVGQMIVINASIFIVVNLIAHLVLGGNERAILEWLALPASITEFIWVPWSIISYMFLHGGLWHVVFNMYMLYWFGRIFGDFMGDKRLTGLYFLGGISGGLLYMLAYNLFYLAGEPTNSMILVGSSAAVMAITVAAGMRFPDYIVNLLFFGAVKLKYVALVIFLLSTVIDFSSNMGGKLAHLGGAAMGYFYIRGLEKGNDYALSFYNLYERFINLFQKSPKLKVVPNDFAKQKKEKRSSFFGGTTESKSKSASDLKETQAKTDAILDKISKSGYENLSKEEKEFLFKLSKNK
ncbi:MAG: rhomboid family intramembrane serine protease [Salibacteraceae bacterium]